MVRDRTGDVIAALRELESSIGPAASSFFYRVRDKRFNPPRRRPRPNRRCVHAGARRDADFPEPDRLQRVVPAQLARARSTCPHGRYANPSICDEDHIRAVAGALERSSVRLLTASFEAVLASAAAGDFIYFDPPYAPVSITSRVHVLHGRGLRR